MPVHDWKPGFAWLFHDFRHGWLSELGHELNRGVLPTGYYALRERWIGGGFELDAARQKNRPDAPAIEERKPHDALAVRRERDDYLVAVCDVALPD